ncbi:PHP domain-containing protein [Tessaracoccus coleopterorum]|uniref:PHP domain-containing protein n=1 Tax=Tessaracoccus coleopterorum TaxID=2714950 RepID=UPI0038CD11D1
MPALAITDHGNLYGAYEFYKASKSFNVKPIIGLEAYLTPAPTGPSASACSSATAPATTSRRRAPTRT